MEYRYGMRLRGFSIGTQPKEGLIRADSDPNGKYHNIVVYNRPLTKEEISEYELDNLNETERNNTMYKNLETMKCSELRIYARELGIKGGNSKGKDWLIPEITKVLEARAAEEAKKASEKKSQTKEKKNRSFNMIEHDGKSLSISAWAKELGMPVATLRARLRNGWTIEQALGKQSAGKSENLIEFNGKKQNLSAWSRELGIPRPTLAARLYRLNWAPEKAFTQATIIG